MTGLGEPNRGANIVQPPTFCHLHAYDTKKEHVTELLRCEMVKHRWHIDLTWGYNITEGGTHYYSLPG